MYVVQLDTITSLSNDKFLSKMVTVIGVKSGIDSPSSNLGLGRFAFHFVPMPLEKALMYLYSLPTRQFRLFSFCAATDLREGKL